MQQAIKRAIEGWWEPDGHSYREVHHKHRAEGITLRGVSTDICIPESLLDHLFWQALGKAEGWFLNTCTFCAKECMRIYDNESSDCCHEEVREGWLYHWHRFIDHLVEGKDTESFFKELLK